MREQLVSLAQLAIIDDSAHDLEEELKNIPIKIDDMRGDVARLQALLDSEKQQLEEAKALALAQHEDLKDRMEGLSRAKVKGAKARTPKEADAAEREVEVNRRLIKTREDEILKLEEAVEKVEVSVASHQGEFDSFESLFRKQEEEARVQLDSIRTRLQTVVTGRNAVVAKIERSTLSRYTRIREQRGSAVAVIPDGTCTGCRVTLAPQNYIELQRGKKLVNCPQCLRFLVFEPLVAEELEVSSSDALDG